MAHYTTKQIQNSVSNVKGLLHKIHDKAKTKAVNVLWQPYKGVQTRMLTAVADEICVAGGKGYGKSDALLTKPLQQIHIKGFKGLILRKTTPELQELLLRAEHYYGSLGAVRRSEPDRFEFYWPDPDRPGKTYKTLIRFGHMEHARDVRKYDGQEWHFIGIDQLEQFSEEEYTHLIGLQRTKKMSGIKLRMFSTANPGGPGHEWIVRRFVRNGKEKLYRDPETGATRIYFWGTYRDNPHLEEGYERKLMATPNPALRKAYLEGDWDVFVGKFFSQINEKIHYVDSFDIPAHWTVGAAMDWGWTDTTTMGFYARSPEGRLYKYKEIVWRMGNAGANDDPHPNIIHVPHGEPLTAQRVVEDLLPRLDVRQEFQMTITCDTSMWVSNNNGIGPSVAEGLQKMLADQGLGISLQKANKDRINGWSRVHEYLHPKQSFSDGTVGPVLRFFKPFGTMPKWGAPYTIKSLQSLIHDPKKPGDTLQGKNIDDHAADETRYFLMSEPELINRSLVPFNLLPKPNVDFRPTRRLVAGMTTYDDVRDALDDETLTDEERDFLMMVGNVNEEDLQGMKVIDGAFDFY